MTQGESKTGKSFEMSGCKGRGTHFSWVGANTGIHRESM